MKYIGIFSLFLLISTSTLQAGGDLFKYDQSYMEKEFFELDNFEKLIETQSFNYETIDWTKTSISNKTLFALGIQSNYLQPNSPFGIPAFIWGCFLGPIGVLIVAVSDDRSGGELFNSTIGCVLAGCIFGGYFWWLPNY